MSRLRWLFVQPRTLRLARVGGAVASLLALSSMTVMQGKELGVRVAIFYACVGDGCLTVGTRDVNLDQSDPFAPDLTLGPLYVRPAWRTDYAFAWRPFHLRVNAADTSITREGIVAPLWPVLIGGAALAAYAQGYLVALRRLRTTHCRTCGYDLRAITSTPTATDPDAPTKFVTCPECGAEHHITASP